MLTSKNCQGEKIEYLHQLILRLVGLIYAFAFSSWYYQIPALYSQNGLMPISKIEWYDLTKMPTLLQIGKNDSTLTLITIFGTLVGLLAFASSKFIKWYTFLILWVLYLSLYTVGQDFSQFQWDIMLLECGFICIIFSLTPVVGRELLRWLAFRLYFSSGLVKLLSQCETWWNLTALHHHFASQCIPHFLSWWAHQIPGELKKLMVAANFYVLIFGAIYFYFPTRFMRIFGFILQFIMQIGIILTGNYNFFNLLSIVLTLVVLDDHFIYKYFPSQIKEFINMPKTIEEFDLKKNNRIYKYSEIVICLYMTGVLIFNFFPYETIMQGKKLPFTVQDIGKYFLTEDNFTYFLLYVLTFFFFYITYFNLQKNSAKSTMAAILQTLIKIVVFIFMFSMSNMTFQQGIGIRQINSPIIPQQYLQQVQQYTYSFHLFNSYGLFRKMTGVNGRPELIFEGSEDGNKWLEYHFHYKPGKINEISPFVVPHQPRLDWQLWFASLQEHPSDLYLIHLVYKMLDGQNINAFVSNNPFQKKPPKFIRINKYLYYFTNVTEMIQTGNFWKRIWKSVYLPPISLQDSQLQSIKQQYGFESAVNKQKEQNTQLPLWTLIMSVIIYAFY
ncbi:unnamed protein product [Paramecium pentaurelia]|uniref:Lipase maturation factor 2 n=1 Tax=Paramecium pentaurelia TaxID=43138 RepID=A0A8S1VER1_9CILI|nr:unnamed protein product [Paramecium pentaurelia]